MMRICIGSSKNDSTCATHLFSLFVSLGQKPLPSCNISSFYYYPFVTNMSATPFLYDFDTLSNLEQDFLKKPHCQGRPIFLIQMTPQVKPDSYLLMTFAFGQSNTKKQPKL